MKTNSQLNNDGNIVYTRQQKGHSVVVHIILAPLTCFVSLIWTIYYIQSPNHYWHL